jgi:hypothetical protein
MSEIERAQSALCIVDGAHLVSKMAELLLGNRDADGAAKRGGLASGFRRLAARLEHIGRDGPPDFRELSPQQVALLEWLPEREEGPLTNSYHAGWNACIDTIRKHREPPKQKKT